MICPICGMGILEQVFDDNGLRYNICDAYGCEVVTIKDLQYNKAKKTVKRKNNNGNTSC